jgi:hypothetical protein
LTWRCFLVSAITIVVVKYSISICVSHGHCSYLQWGSLAWCAAWYAVRCCSSAFLCQLITALRFAASPAAGTVCCKHGL